MLNATNLQVIKSENEAITLLDLYCVGLYADLKSMLALYLIGFCYLRSLAGDIITHDTSFPRVASLLAILHSNRELFVNDMSLPAIHYVLKRYISGWHSSYFVALNLTLVFLIAVALSLKFPKKSVRC